MLEYLKSPEAQALMKEEAKERAEKEQKIRAFYGSPEFLELYDRLYEATKHGFIQDDNDYMECCPTVKSKELEEMMTCLNLVDDDNPGEHLQQVKLVTLSGFAEDSFRYKELIFQTICGQGCITRVMRAEDTPHTVFSPVIKDDFNSLEEGAQY